jgi:tyrosyl-tRNA synthetase
MTLFQELSWRGFVNQVTHEELGDQLEKEPVTLYCGFDPTADSLHIGSLLPIMGLVHFQRHGHKPLVLVGGGTGLIGDPSGKVQERQLLTKELVEQNVQGIRAQLERFVDFEGVNAARMVNNADWLCTLPLVDFLRDIGKHFTVNVMLAKDSVRQRINDREQGMSFTEFSYSLLQAYDFLHLSDAFGCSLQIGGSDQWGNIVAGMDLIRRLRDRPAFGFTFPLVTKADGSKFGKSEGGNIWLDPNRTSPYKFFQFWINQSDSDTPRWLRYFTFLEQAVIEECERQIAEEPEKRAAQRKLAEEVTKLVHGEAALENAIRASQAMFGGDIRGLDDATLDDVFSEVPSYKLDRAILSQNRQLVEVLVEVGVFKSKGEARRLIDNGGLYLNSQRVDAADAPLTEQSLCSVHTSVVRKGKKDYHLLKFENQNA